MPYVKPSVSIEERLNAYITRQSGGCWIWSGPQIKLGYGQIMVRGKVWLAHRLAYVTWRGPIPEGLGLDHLCRTPACVNPDHLEPVTHVENIRRGRAPSAHALRTNHCIHGHEYTPENTYRQGRTGRRYCRECILIRRRRERGSK